MALLSPSSPHFQRSNGTTSSSLSGEQSAATERELSALKEALLQERRRGQSADEESALLKRKVDQLGEALREESAKTAAERTAKEQANAANAQLTAKVAALQKSLEETQQQYDLHRSFSLSRDSYFECQKA